MRWLLVILAIGCTKKRVDAPQEMEDIARFVFQNFDNDEEVAAGLEQLVAWIEPNLGTDDALTGYRLSTLKDEDTQALPQHPNRDQSVLLGAAVLSTSPHDLAAHARTMVLDDQTYANPGNYSFYVRTVSSSDEPGFLAGTGRVDTSNDIQTQSFGIRIPYILIKDYRWVEGDFGTAIVARSHIPESGCASGGDNCLMQSFSDDIWIKTPDRSDTIRFTATWNEVKSPATAFITNEQQIGALAAGMVRVFENTDAFIADGMP